MAKSFNMFRKYTSQEIKYILYGFTILISTILVTACASIGTPSGGDYDLDPPKVVQATPTFNSTNVKKGKVEIIFDELIQIEKPDEKVIITPPQKNTPTIRAINNKIAVELRDTLLPNTTYTIDFTDAIADYNEKNVLENFAISFSTGDIVDSLAISGKVLSADNLEPVSSIFVGIHEDLSDTAFTTKPFLRISRTNEIGQFSIKGVAPGKYKIYALTDINREYKYNDPSQTIAFLDDIIVPSTEQAIRADSVFDLKNLLDTVKMVNYTRFLPDNIILRSFKSNFKRQYLQKAERPTDDVLNIFFGSATEMPQIEVIDIPSEIENWSILERSVGNDSLKFWITKPGIIAMDSIRLKISYMATDTLNQLQPQTDTITFINRNKKQAQKEKNKKKGEEETVEFINIKTNIVQAFDVYKNLDLEFSIPVPDLRKDQLNLQILVDSIYENVPFEMFKDSLNPRKYTLNNNWKQGSEYKFLIDSAAITGYNGMPNNKLESKFKIKTEDQYGVISFYIVNVPDSVPSYLELLDKSDKVVRKVKVTLPKTTIKDLNPGTYYARLIIDNNGNEKWDTGDYYTKKQPDLVYYYDKGIELKPFWEMEEDWDITALPLDKQKPLEITKNKPKDLEKKKKDLEKKEANQNKKKQQQERDKRNNSGVNNSTMNGNTLMY